MEFILFLFLLFLSRMKSKKIPESKQTFSRRTKIKPVIRIYPKGYRKLHDVEETRKYVQQFIELNHLTK